MIAAGTTVVVVVGDAPTGVGVGVVVLVVPPPFVASSAVVSSDVAVSGVPIAQLDCVIVFVSRFTAAVCASSLPWIVAPVLAVIVSAAITVPTNFVPVPSVAEEPTCQKTLHACAPLISCTVVFEPVDQR